MKRYHAGRGSLRQYLNNVSEQDRRRIKRRVRPMLGFKRSDPAAVTIRGIEVAEKIKRGQFHVRTPTGKPVTIPEARSMVLAGKKSETSNRAAKQWDLIHRSSRSNPIREVRTLFGHRRLIPKGVSDWNVFTSLVNTPIQGSCADALKMAVLELQDALPAGTFIVALLHDEIVIETDPPIAQEVCDLTIRKMETWAGRMFDRVPMPAEGKPGSNWADKGG